MISDTITKVTLSGNGITTAFPYTFPLGTDDGSDLVVYLIDPNGTQTLLTTNYTLDLSHSQIIYPTVTTPLQDPLPSLWKIVIMRVESLTQLLDLVNGSNFNAENIEGAFDFLTLICQQLQEQLNRVVLLPVNINTQVTLPSPTSTIADAAIAAAGEASVSAQASAASAAQAAAYVASLGSINKGLDASKSVSPSLGDVYFAYDTQIIYICKVAGAWVELKINASNINGVIPAGNLPTDNVKLTGGQTIDGVKTFTSSPVVPTPTTDYQASTKKYTDDSIAAIPATPQLSNVVFSFGLGKATTGTGVGWFSTPSSSGTGLSPAWCNNSSTYKTMIMSKFTKIAGQTYITVWALMDRDSSNNDAYCNTIIGGVSGAVDISGGSIGSGTPAWGSVIINVSSLTNGTTYDLTIQIKSQAGGGGNNGVYLYSVIGIAS